MQFFDQIERWADLWPESNQCSWNSLNRKQLSLECSLRGRVLCEEVLKITLYVGIQVNKADKEPALRSKLRKYEQKRQILVAEKKTSSKTMCKKLWVQLRDMHDLVAFGFSEKSKEEEETKAEKAKKDLYDHWDEIATEWLRDFSQFHFPKAVRVYVHILVSHGKDLLDLHGPLDRFCNQGFEAANGRDTNNFFNHTRRCGGRIAEVKKEEMSDKEHFNLETYSTMLSLPYLKLLNDVNF